MAAESAYGSAAATAVIGPPVVIGLGVEIGGAESLRGLFPEDPVIQSTVTEVQATTQATLGPGVVEETVGEEALSVTSSQSAEPAMVFPAMEGGTQATLAAPVAQGGVAGEAMTTTSSETAVAVTVPPPCAEGIALEGATSLSTSSGAMTASAAPSVAGAALAADVAVSSAAADATIGGIITSFAADAALVAMVP